MELSWTTFVLEVINFLVLVWILKHFLYQPVLEIIARRRAMTESRLSEAQTLKAEAEALQLQYKDRLTSWDRERQQARDVLTEELEAERNRRMAELQTLLQQEREKVRVAETRRQTDERRKMEATALSLGARFAGRLLEQGSGPDTQARLIDLLISELAQLSSERISALQNHYGQVLESISVVSAFPIPGQQHRRLEQALSQIAGAKLPLHFSVNGSLIAGVQVTLGAWVLAANLRDELVGFAELASHD